MPKTGLGALLSLDFACRGIQNMDRGALAPANGADQISNRSSIGLKPSIAQLLKFGRGSLPFRPSPVNRWMESRESLSSRGSGSSQQH